MRQSLDRGVRRLFSRLGALQGPNKSLHRFRLSSTLSSTLTEPASSITTQQPEHKIILSGIQPTGVPHLGNYLGALRQWKLLSDETTPSGTSPLNTCYFSVVDLHALTDSRSPSQLAQSRLETLASLIAIGLTPSSSSTCLFLQSDVPQHTELMWILSTLTSTGYLSRMTQWKTKLGLDPNASLDEKEARARLKLGLFAYPVLQAADVLLYGTTHVPVGADQLQHLELTRALAQSFNHHYCSSERHIADSTSTAPPEIETTSLKETNIPPFPLPQPLLSSSPRIMSLQNPLNKMSKSDPNPATRILITDPPDIITSKIRHALTDSTQGPITYDPDHRPGVSNLIEMLWNVQQIEKQQPDSSGTGTTSSDQDNVPVSHETIHTFTQTHLSALSLAALKSLLASTLTSHFSDLGIRDIFLELTSSASGEQTLRDARQRGKQTARRKAEEVMSGVREAVGIV